MCTPMFEGSLCSHVCVCVCVFRLVGRDMREAGLQAAGLYGNEEKHR